MEKIKLFDKKNPNKEQAITLIREHEQTVCIDKSKTIVFYDISNNDERNKFFEGQTDFTYYSKYDDMWSASHKKENVKKYVLINNKELRTEVLDALGATATANLKTLNILDIEKFFLCYLNYKTVYYITENFKIDDKNPFEPINKLYKLGFFPRPTKECWKIAYKSK